MDVKNKEISDLSALGFWNYFSSKIIGVTSLNSFLIISTVLFQFFTIYEDYANFVVEFNLLNIEMYNIYLGVMNYFICLKTKKKIKKKHHWLTIK